jgi:hypothetical protein
MTCERAAIIAKDVSRYLSRFHSDDEVATAAGVLERHYRRECACYGTTNDTIGLRKPAHIDWDLFDDD